MAAPHITGVTALRVLAKSGVTASEAVAAPRDADTLISPDCVTVHRETEPQCRGADAAGPDQITANSAVSRFSLESATLAGKVNTAIDEAAAFVCLQIFSLDHPVALDASSTAGTTRPAGQNKGLPRDIA